MTISCYKEINLQKTHVFLETNYKTLAINFLVHNFYGKSIYYIIDVNIVPEMFYLTKNYKNLRMISISF